MGLHPILAIIALMSGSAIAGPFGMLIAVPLAACVQIIVLHLVPKLAEGTKCARSWRIAKDVGADPAFPELSARDAAAVREFDARADR